MLRGNLEDLEMSKFYGLAEECQRKFKEDITSPNSIFRQICDLFNYLPLAAIISDKNIDKIVCVHSGIGENVKTLEDISSIKKPYTIYETPAALDIVWNTPIEAYQENEYIKTNFTCELRKKCFNQKMVEDFLKNNKLDLIIRTHDVIETGYEDFYNKKVISIFSSTNYCNAYNNSGAIIFIKKSFIIQPKILTSEENYSVWGNSNYSNDYPPSPRKILKNLNM